MQLLYISWIKTASFFKNTQQAFWSFQSIKIIFLSEFYNWAIALIHMVQG